MGTETAVWAVMEDNEYTGCLLVSLWATEELAEREAERLNAEDQHFFVEEYPVHFEARSI